MTDPIDSSKFEEEMMQVVNSFLHTLNRELGEITAQMDTTAWIALSAITVLAGWFFLRGNIIKSA